MTIDEKKKKKKKKGDRCVRIAKRKYDVWPSAYASGAVVKCRKGKIWKGLSEEELNEMIDEELEGSLEEGMLDFFRNAALAGTIATSAVNPSSVRAEKPTITQQEKLDELSIASLGYLEAYTRYKKSETPDEIYKAMEAIQNNKKVKNKKISDVIKIAKEKVSKIKKEDKEKFESYKRMGSSILKIETHSFGGNKIKFDKQKNMLSVTVNVEDGDNGEFAESQARDLTRQWQKKNGYDGFSYEGKKVVKGSRITPEIITFMFQMQKALEEKKKPDFKKEKESGLHGWFSRQGGKGKSKGWVDCNTCRKDKKTGKKTCKTCGRKEGEKRAKYPSCRPKPSDCGSSGKGKEWGKKSAKKENLSLQNESSDVVLDLEEIRKIVKEVIQNENNY